MKIGGIENAISSLAKELKIDSYEVVEIVEKEKT